MNLFDQCVKTMQKVVELQKPLYMLSFFEDEHQAQTSHSISECGTACCILGWMVVDLAEDDPLLKVNANERPSTLWDEFSDFLERNNLPDDLSYSMFAACAWLRSTYIRGAIAELRKECHPLADILEQNLSNHQHLQYDEHEYDDPAKPSVVALDFVEKIRDILNPYLRE